MGQRTEETLPALPGAKNAISLLPRTDRVSE